MLIEMKGRVFSTPAAITVLFDGMEIHSGQVGLGVPLDVETELVSHEWTGAQPTDIGSVSVSVTSGVITVGPVFQHTGGYDMRKNILINGQPPSWPATTMDFMPGGTEDDPNWSGWFFEVAAGETITFNVEVDVPEENTV